ncbi:MAG: GGDEF domain-containing protein [Pseudomonadota bacterium]
MSYPTPPQAMLSEWQSVVDSIQSHCAADHALVHMAYPSSFDVLVATAGETEELQAGSSAHRDGSHYCDDVLSKRMPICVADANESAHWDGITERRSGWMSYCGTPLLWPDEEAFGTLALLSRTPLPKERASQHLQLISCLGRGMNAQLALLYREQQSAYEASHDNVTGLFNARKFKEFAKAQIEGKRNSDQGLWLLLWSIDGLGELASFTDEDKLSTLLRAMAERARGCVRQTDILARLDTNQFAMLIPEANEFIAASIGDRIQRAVRRLGADLGTQSAITLSCGVACYQENESYAGWRSRCYAATLNAEAVGGNQLIAASETSLQ